LVLTTPVALRLGCTRESCGEEGDEVVARLCKEGDEVTGERGLDRKRFDSGEVGQKGGEI
jgi:hypothetical protein